MDSPYDSQLKFRSFADDESSLVAPSPQVVKTKDDSTVETPARSQVISGPVFESTVSELNPVVTPIMKKTKDYVLTPLTSQSELNATNDEDLQPPEDQQFELPKCGIILRRPEYFTKPSISELDERIKDRECLVRDFTVGRDGYGQVTFLGLTNVYGLNLDEIGKFLFH